MSPMTTLLNCTDSVTGYTKLIAGKTEGIVYLKYVIDEDVYATAEKPKSYATNNSSAFHSYDCSQCLQRSI